MASTDSAWAFQDPQTRQRRNREWIIGRLLHSAYDVNSTDGVTVTAKAIDGAAVTTAESTPYTATTSIYRSVIQSLRLTNNTTGTNHQIRLHIVNSTGSSAAGNRIFSDLIGAGESITLRGPWFADPGDTVKVSGVASSGTQVAIRGEALEIHYQPSGLDLIVDDGVALTTSYATRYTCPGSNVRHSNAMAVTLCNTVTSATPSADVQVIPNGQSANDIRKVHAATLQAGESVILGGADDPLILEPGDFIQARASVASIVSCRITPLEFATS